MKKVDVCLKLCTYPRRRPYHLPEDRSYPPKEKFTSHTGSIYAVQETSFTLATVFHGNAADIPGLSSFALVFVLLTKKLRPVLNDATAGDSDMPAETQYGSWFEAQLRSLSKLVCGKRNFTPCVMIEEKAPKSPRPLKLDDPN